MSVHVLLKLLADNELIKDPKLFFFGEIFALSNPTILFFACLFLQQTICLAFIGNKYRGQEKFIIDGI